MPSAGAPACPHDAQQAHPAQREKSPPGTLSTCQQAWSRGSRARRKRSAVRPSNFCRVRGTSMPPAIGILIITWDGLWVVREGEWCVARSLQGQCRPAAGWPAVSCRHAASAPYPPPSAAPDAAVSGDTPTGCAKAQRQQGQRRAPGSGAVRLQATRPGHRQSATEAELHRQCHTCSLLDSATLAASEMALRLARMRGSCKNKLPQCVLLGFCCGFPAGMPMLSFGSHAAGAQAGAAECAHLLEQGGRAPARARCLPFRAALCRQCQPNVFFKRAQQSPPSTR